MSEYDVFPGAEKYEWTQVTGKGVLKRLEIYPRLGMYRVFVRLPGAKREHLVREARGLSEHRLFVFGEMIASSIDGGNHGIW